MSLKLNTKDAINLALLDQLLGSPGPLPRKVKERALLRVRGMAVFLENNGYAPEDLADFFGVSTTFSDFDSVVILAAENLTDAYLSGCTGGELCNVH